MGQASQVKCVFVIGLAARRLARSTLGKELPRHSPVTSSKPDGSCFKKTQRLPRKWPDNKINTVPGAMLARNLGACCQHKR
jgi:hypothetical protein